MSKKILLHALFVFIITACANQIPPKPELPKEFTPGGKTIVAVTRIPAPESTFEPRCIRVLSIDGGGIRGIIPAMILAEIERRTQKRIADLFDLIVGTSTGGIIALGLTVPNPKDPFKPLYKAQELVEFYEKNGEAIFPSPNRGWREIKWIFRPKYNTDEIEKIFKQYFGDMALCHALTNIQITAYEIEERKHYFFTNNEHNVMFYMRDVARATSAAPTFFPPVRLPIPININSKGYITLIDGGVFANNPALYALRYAPNTRFYPASLQRSNDILLLSIGTGTINNRIPFEEAYNWGIFGWFKSLIDITISDPGVEKDLERLMSEPEYSYLRLQPDLTGLTGDLDDATEDNIKELKKRANQFIREKEEDLMRISAVLNMKRPTNCPPSYMGDRCIGDMLESLEK